MRLLTNLDVRYIFHLQYIFYILGFEQTDRYEGAVEGEKNLKMKAARMERGLSQTDLANAVGGNATDHRPHRSRPLQPQLEAVRGHLQNAGQNP